MSSKVLLALAVLLAAVAVLVGVGGGARVVIGGVGVSVRSPVLASVMAGVAFAAWAVLASRGAGVARDLDEAWAFVQRRAASIIAAIGLGSTVAAGCFATGSAAGADASGYLSQAVLWGSGSLMWFDPLLGLAGWTGRAALTAPLGWGASLEPGFQVPTYAPGLPLLLAIPHAMGGARAASLVVSLAAGAAVWCTGRLAMLVADGAAGVVAALVLAVTPVFLYQSVQLMSDVPVTAAWMLCWLLIGTVSMVRRSVGLAVLAGIAAGLAVLIRPNLAPLAAVPLGALALARFRSRGLSQALVSISFAVPVACAGVVLGCLQWHWYGSPWRSGYGTAADLFALSNASPNAVRYARWLVETSPLLALSPLGFAVGRPTVRWPLAAFAALVVASYLVYFAFDEWSYLRFLLPALAVMAVWCGAAASAAVGRLPAAARFVVSMAFLLAVAAHGIAEARARGAFALVGQQQRVAELGQQLRARIPATAVIVSGEQSGSLRYYTGRSILRWDDATPEEMGQALAALAAAGRVVVVALDGWEEPLVRTKFKELPIGLLDWPPFIEAGDTHRTRAWRLDDRDGFMRGDRVETERLR